MRVQHVVSIKRQQTFRRQAEHLLPSEDFQIREVIDRLKECNAKTVMGCKYHERRKSMLWSSEGKWELNQ